MTIRRSIRLVSLPQNSAAGLPLAGTSSALALGARLLRKCMLPVTLLMLAILPATAEEDVAKLCGYSLSPDVAISSCTQFLESGPHSSLRQSIALQNRGIGYRNKGDLNRAIADFDQALRLNPQLAEAFNSRGIAHAKNGDLTRAIADFNQAIALKPTLGNAYFNRGVAHKDKGDLDSAIADLDQVIRLDRKDAAAYMNRGFFYHLKGNTRQALADRSQAMRLGLRVTGM